MQYLIIWYTALTYEFLDLCVGMMSLPSFHAVGFWIQMIVPLYVGSSIATYPPIVKKPQMLPVQATPDNIIEHLKRTRCDAYFSMPVLLQIWAQSPSSVEVLRSLRLVVSTGLTSQALWNT